PSLVLGAGLAGTLMRFTRTQMLEVMRQDYIRTARAKGLSEMTVLTRHVARNALLPLVTIFGLSLVTVLEGSFFVETLWGIPGAGRLAFESVNDRDYDLLLALVLMIAVAFMVINIVVDVAYAFIDPRVRISGRGAQT
ncbi:MAG TPA: ABC transporter permease, partial [Dehalococcoidia bacterium]|nr:ABC transporter permease [Dehalococcoidia bacterium]